MENHSAASLIQDNAVTRVRLSEHGIVVPINDDIPYLRKDDPQDAGYDVFAAKDMWIFPFCVRKVPVNAIVELPNQHYGRVTGRSGETLAGNIVLPGTIDPGYRGQFHAHMFRIGLFPKKIRKGDKIAQLIVVPYVEVEWAVGTEGDLSKTQRGKKGFGSSGKR